MMARCCTKKSLSLDNLTADIADDPVHRRTFNVELQEGFTFLIGGQIPRNADRFIIDFCTDNAKKDIALRIGFHGTQKTMACNCRISGTWGRDESNTEIPLTFTFGWDFEVQVFFNTDFIFIAFDAMHIAKYRHRLPFTDIRSLEIRGHIQNVSISHKYTTDYPLRNRSTPHVSNLCGRYSETANQTDINMQTSWLRIRPKQFLPLPFYATFDRGFFRVGYSIIIKGYIHSKGEKFRVALQTNQNVFPNPTIAMQLEFLFPKTSDGGMGEPVVALNTYAEDEWIGEVRVKLLTPLRPGSYINLVIERCRKSFDIRLNKTYFHNYPEIIDTNYVNTCLVEGDIKLIDVLIESD